MTRPTTVEEYLAGLEGAALERLRDLRALCREAAPTAEETIKWGAPAYVHADGVILFVLDAHRHHAAVVFTPSTREAFDADLAGYETGKGSVKLPYDKAVPREVLRRMIAFRIREHEVDGVKWM